MSTVTPTGPILDLYRYNILLNVYKLGDYGVHLTNLRFRLFRRDETKDPNQPVDDNHILIADESGLDSPILFPISAATDYFIRVTKSGYRRAERNLGWRINADKLKFSPLIYGENYGTIQGPCRVYSEDIAPGGIFPEEYLAKWGAFDILLEPGGSSEGIPSSGTMIIDQGFNIKCLICSGKYEFNSPSGSWSYVGPEYTHTKVSDMCDALIYNYPSIDIKYVKTYKEWSVERFRTYIPGTTPKTNEHNFQLWITNENGDREAEAFEMYVEFGGPSTRYEFFYE